MPGSSGSRYPVFYDSERKRWRWVMRLFYTLLILVGFGVCVFVISIWSQPLLPHRPLPRAKESKEGGTPDPALAERVRARRHFAFKRDERALRHMISQDRLQTVVPPPVPVAKNSEKNAVCIGFYVNWEETSKASLQRNIQSLTHFMPEWLHLNADGSQVQDARIPEDRLEIDPLVRQHDIPILPILNNYINVSLHEHQGEWSSEALHGLVSDPKRRTSMILRLRDMLLREKWQGINLDLEQPYLEDKKNLVDFVEELATVFHAAGLLVTQSLAVDDPGFDRPALAQANDFIIPMIYDEHSPGDENGAGSIASAHFTEEMYRTLFEKERIPANKVVLGIGNYAYDWIEGQNDGESISYQAAVVQAKESQDPENLNVAHIAMDKASLNPFYRYFDDEGKAHVVWMLDATTSYNQWRAAQKYHPLGVALWYLGGEDPSVWQIIGKDWLKTDQGSQIDAGLLDVITYKHQSQVDFEGEGELLTVLAEPKDGARTIRRDATTGYIESVRYQEYPTSWVVRRAGYQKGRIILTFDDGPDPRFTPQILDILKHYNIKATFFIVGSQAAENPDLIQRIWEEGHELGNHTFTHPNLANVGEKRTLLELSTTQRVIESLTGHSTLLFRPPYAIDMEPRTGDDVKSILIASRFNFLAVGNAIDPQDWNLNFGNRTTADVVKGIVDTAWDEKDKGNVVLLHDGGGNRVATVEALPILIERLLKAGYHFSTLAEMRGVSRNEINPPVRFDERLLVGVDFWVFETTYWLQRILATLFTLSVILGVTRQVILGNLAVFQFRRERKRESQLSMEFRTGVSVVIAAYNEEKVISRTIQTVLDSSYPVSEVIVVDDGSKDATTAVVERDFAGNPRVRCFRKENGGKSSALNFGMQYVTGEVIIALDADTLFAPDTIGRLVRHFEDPKVGAVAGNVRVGNIQNLLTRWQALEYVTSQNFDRRAYDLLNCITVVPGAVGAWRKAAIEQVGGYTHDTLAEDTDLTWSVRQAGWKIVNDSTALAFTEAPETLTALSRQRFRWAFGTLQNLWKHRRALGQYGSFGTIALPSLWLYQILFPAISPIMDIAVVWALFAGNFARVLFYYGLMVFAEFLGAVIAIWMDKSDWRLLPSLFIQRFVYRQLMYYVIIRSVVAALRGGAVGWNKLERTGNAQAT